jgi:nicotinamide mononucleotide adenylyltransferase
MARDRIKDSTRFYVVGGYFSPTSDAYNKIGLARWQHRICMCELATEESDWIMVDPWEASQFEWQRTVLVLDHFNYQLNVVRRQIGTFISFFRLVLSTLDPQNPHIRILLLAGGDLIESFGTPYLWDPLDVHE